MRMEDSWTCPPERIIIRILGWAMAGATYHGLEVIRGRNLVVVRVFDCAWEFDSN